jgi:hypothetical protein
MIELDGYGIGPPADAIQTEAVPKPTPESDPLGILEKDWVLGPFDCGVLFSSGYDSLGLVIGQFLPNLFEPWVARYR